MLAISSSNNSPRPHRASYRIWSAVVQDALFSTARAVIVQLVLGLLVIGLRTVDADGESVSILK